MSDRWTSATRQSRRPNSTALTATLSGLNHLSEGYRFLACAVAQSSMRLDNIGVSRYNLPAALSNIWRGSRVRPAQGLGESFASLREPRVAVSIGGHIRSRPRSRCFSHWPRKYLRGLLKIGLPDNPKFLTSELALSKNHGVRAYISFLNGNPVSYLYCRVKDKIVSYNYHGYDPAYAKLSPGTVLQILALEALFKEQRFTTFYFTEGEGSHKERFSTGNRLCGDVYVIRRRIMPISFVMLHHAVNTTSASAGNHPRASPLDVEHDTDFDRRCARRRCWAARFDNCCPDRRDNICGARSLT
jgi:Acetyltransferase (GNAT) domain